MRGNESANQKRRKRYTHYPVPSKVKVGNELEMTSGVDMTLYSRDQGHWHEQNIKSIRSYLRNKC